MGECLPIGGLLLYVKTRADFPCFASCQLTSFLLACMRPSFVLCFSCLSSSGTNHFSCYSDVSPAFSPLRYPSLVLFKALHHVRFSSWRFEFSPFLTLLPFVWLASWEDRKRTGREPIAISQHHALLSLTYKHWVNRDKEKKKWRTKQRAERHDGIGIHAQKEERGHPDISVKSAKKGRRREGQRVGEQREESGGGRERAADQRR